MSSLYSALLKALEDETLSAPPLPTDVPGAPPLPAEVPVKLDGAPVEPVEPPPVTPPAEPAPVVAAEPALPPRRRYSTVGADMGLGMADVLAEPRTPNPARLTSDLSRASTTLGSALAGVKPNYDFSENLERRGAHDAAAADKTNDAMTDFKRQLMLKVVQDKASKQKEGMRDPTSSEYLALVAQIEGNELLKTAWDKITARAREYGTVPDPDRFLKDFKFGTAASQEGATDRTKMGITAREAGREDSQVHAKDMAQIGLENSIKKLTFADALKELGEVRHANVPDMPVRPGATPTATDAEKVKFNNYKTQKVADGLDSLMNYMRAHPDAFDKLNPFDDPRSELSVLYGKVRDAYRIAEDFGVPSGNDMAMIADVVKDPRRFLNVFSGRDMAAFEALKRETLRERDLFARSRGYDPTGGGGATPGTKAEDPRETVRRRILGASNPPPAGAKVTPGGKPYVIKAADKQGNVVYFDENGDEVQ